MAKYRKADAILDLIEAKAIELGKKEILVKFVWSGKQGVLSIKKDVPIKYSNKALQRTCFAAGR